ncbi:MAG: hypothetical protein GY909_00925 [Oligoflexia bacterium]|nr:hypothetical protein [Oligoflexia bacterium]
MFDSYPTQSDAYEFFSGGSRELKGLVTVTSGNTDRCVLISGGIHGDESCGPSSMTFIARHLRANMGRLNGTVHFLLGNPEAFGARKRFMEKDLNRSFLSSYSDSYEAKRGKEIEKFLINNRNIKGVLDLHSVPVGDTQMLIYKVRDKDIAQRVSPISTHLLYDDKHLKGLFLKAADRYLNCFTAAVECGNHTAKESHLRSMFHILSMLKEFEIFDEPELLNLFSSEVDDGPIITRYEIIESITPKTGFKYVIPKVATGVQISKGMIYAQSDEGNHQATKECCLVLPSKDFKMEYSEFGFLCSKEIITRKISS